MADDAAGVGETVEIVVGGEQQQARSRHRWRRRLRLGFCSACAMFVEVNTPVARPLHQFNAMDVDRANFAAAVFSATEWRRPRTGFAPTSQPKAGKAAVDAGAASSARLRQKAMARGKDASRACGGALKNYAGAFHGSGGMG